MTLTLSKQHLPLQLAPLKLTGEDASQGGTTRPAEDTQCPLPLYVWVRARTEYQMTVRKAPLLAQVTAGNASVILFVLAFAVASGHQAQE